MGRYNSNNNCMAYALGRKVWMLPRYWETFARNDEPSSEHKMVARMKQDFNLKEITRTDMVLGKEYIAFRWGYDSSNNVDDFHFMKRHKTGHWTHKMGGQPVKGISEKFVFSDCWDFSYQYNSQIYLFEVLS